MSMSNDTPCTLSLLTHTQRHAAFPDAANGNAACCRLPDAAEQPAYTLLLIDGTWPEAREMMNVSASAATTCVVRSSDENRTQTPPACVAIHSSLRTVLTARPRNSLKRASHSFGIEC